MRWIALALALSVGCASHRPPTVPVPPPTPGRVTAVAVEIERVGDVQPIAVAITNGRDSRVRVDPRQIFAPGRGWDRIAPLPPPEAARLAGGAHLPGAVRGAATGVVSGGLFGALGGAIAGAIQGGIGAAVAAGSAVGAVIGGITGAIGGGHAPAPDVAGFEDRALRAGVLEPGFSTSGYVYYPAWTYRTLELLVSDERQGVLREVVPITPRQ